jgi:hypothetical protein
VCPLSAVSGSANSSKPIRSGRLTEPLEDRPGREIRDLGIGRHRSWMLRRHGPVVQNDLGAGKRLEVVLCDPSILAVDWAASGGLEGSRIRQAAHASRCAEALFCALLSAALVGAEGDVAHLDASRAWSISSRMMREALSRLPLRTIQANADRLRIRGSWSKPPKLCGKRRRDGLRARSWSRLWAFVIVKRWRLPCRRSP